MNKLQLWLISHRSLTQFLTFVFFSFLFSAMFVCAFMRGYNQGAKTAIEAMVNENKDTVYLDACFIIDHSEIPH